MFLVHRRRGCCGDCDCARSPREPAGLDRDGRGGGDGVLATIARSPQVREIGQQPLVEHSSGVQRRWGLPFGTPLE
jgi:hypothetical protein